MLSASLFLAVGCLLLAVYHVGSQAGIYVSPPAARFGGYPCLLVETW
jgi:hypothetical protein